MNSRRKVVILGGGTAGWMTAATFAKFLPSSKYIVTLIESDEIGTVGVGEATLPHLRKFNELLEIDENEFISTVGATYKLGIEFPDWGDLNSSYIHPFGLSGQCTNGIDFHHYWLRLHSETQVAPYDEFSICALAARDFKFAYPNPDPDALDSEYSYAFHIDASLYAKYLKEYAIARGVVRTEGKVVDVHLDNENGDISQLHMESGEKIAGNIFIDCSGFRGVLIEKTLHTGFESWKHWLPCDRAWAAPTQRVENPPPFTRARAKSAGWQWRIPLQHRTGNGLVYSSEYLSDENAFEDFISGLEEPRTDEPRLLKFTAGKRSVSWNRNCIAIGLSAGFLEPLESTSLYLIQIAIMKLLEYFPQDRITDVERGQFNDALNTEYLRVRDFLILHYHATTRDDSEFWRYCREMSIPESLKEKIELYTATGVVTNYRQGLFMPASWLAVYLGQGLIPRSFDARVSTFPIEKIDKYLNDLRRQLIELAKNMPAHSLAIQNANLKKGVAYPRAVMSLYSTKL